MRRLKSAGFVPLLSASCLLSPFRLLLSQSSALYASPSSPPMPLCPSRAVLHTSRSPHEQHHHLPGPHGRPLVPRVRQPAALRALAEERCPGGAGAAADLSPVHAVRVPPPHPQPGHHRHGLLPVRGQQHPGHGVHDRRALCQIR